MLNQETAASSSWLQAAEATTTRNTIAFTSLVFAMLQSICTFFAALNGLRVGIGISSLVMAASTAKAIDSFHVDWLRVPMISLAIAGSLLNLIVIWQIRRLRARPAAQWRRSSVPARKIGSERMQIALSLVTLILIALEERQHLIWLHHL